VAKSNIDEDRGVLIRHVPELGMEIYMYRDTPGVWLNAYGTPVAPDLARKAGFDVDRYLKLKQRRDMMSQAQAAIEKQLDLEASQPGARTVILERDGFKIVQTASGRCVVEAPDGTALTGTAQLNETAARAIFDQICPPAAPAPSEAEGVPSADVGGGAGRPGPGRAAKK